MALIGTGGLGSPAALYLAAAGVGTIGLVDFDVVEESNLQRQVIHGTGALGQSKLDSASGRIRDLNPHVHVERFETRLTSENALEILADCGRTLANVEQHHFRSLTYDPNARWKDRGVAREGCRSLADDHLRCRRFAGPISAPDR